jgi:hypothetical protein
MNHALTGGPKDRDHGAPIAIERPGGDHVAAGDAGSAARPWIAPRS